MTNMSPEYLIVSIANSRVSIPILPFHLLILLFHLLFKICAINNHFLLEPSTQLKYKFIMNSYVGPILDKILGTPLDLLKFDGTTKLQFSFLKRH